MFAYVLFIGVTNEMTVQPVVWLERMVFYRERAAGVYSALTYALAQVTIEFPHVFTQAPLYSSVVYSMATFEWRVVKFMWHFFLMLYCTYLSYTFSGVVSVPVLVLWILFSGAMISRTRCPPWWRWFFSANPTGWCLYGLIASQYGDVETSQRCL
ncbi:hypothetical protein SUGI_0479450 [Cryptomeria japonica]|nr:hypothetical protein SUGI_0479450 [Cryptomeria japonica]